MSNLEKYGLGAMGITDEENFNAAMRRIVRENFGESDIDQGYGILRDCLEELYAKAERVTQGRCSGSKMFERMGSPAFCEKKNRVMTELFAEVSKVWTYEVEIKDGVLRKIGKEYRRSAEAEI